MALKPILISSLTYDISISSEAEPVSGLLASRDNWLLDKEILTDLDLSENIVETLSTDSENTKQSKDTIFEFSVGITFS